MDKEWIKFLKDYDTYKKDAVVLIDKATCESLVNLKIAEKTVNPETAVLDKVLNGLSETFTKAINTAVETSIKSINDNVEKKFKIFAEPRDHEEEKKCGFKHVGEFYESVRIAGSKSNPKIDEKLTKMMEKGAASGANTQDDVEGGYLVPEMFASEMLDRGQDPLNLIPRTDGRQTISNNLTVNGFTESSRKDTFRDGGVLAYWEDEADLHTASQTKFHKVRMRIHKLSVLTYVTDEEISDSSGISFGQVLNKKARNAIMFKANNSLINGTGAGQPLGILNSDVKVKVAIEVNQAVGTILHANLNKMYHRMPANNRLNAVWLVHPNLEEKLPLIAFNDEASGSGQHPVYLPGTWPGLVDAPFGTLYGRPVLPLEYCPDLGTPGDIIFADFSQYMTLTKVSSRIAMASSVHVRFLYDETAFKWTFRLDGQPAWKSGVEDFKGTTIRSPFIILGDRTSASESTGI